MQSSCGRNVPRFFERQQGGLGDPGFIGLFVPHLRCSLLLLVMSDLVWFFFLGGGVGEKEGQETVTDSPVIKLSITK